MTEGSIWKHLLRFALPLGLGLLFQQFYNTVDAIIVGKFVGTGALAAVGSTSSIVNMLVGLCAGFSTGASVIVAQRYGAHDNEGLRRAVNTTLLVTAALCLIATPVGVLIVNPMLKLMATPEDVFPEAASYLTIYFAGIAGLLVYNMGSAILRAVGDSRRPLYFLIISALLNIGGDLLLVVVFKMGIAGAAWATVISQFLSALLVLVSLTRTDAPYAIVWRGIALDLPSLKNIMSIGLPAGVQQAITAFSNVFVQSYINYFGSLCMAGWSSYNKLDVYILVPVQSLALASTTFVGQNYGSGHIERTRKGVREALGLSLVITAVLSALLVVFSRPLITLFTDDAAVIEYGARFIGLISPFYVMFCFNQICAGALRGIGNARTPMLIMLGSFVVFRQIYLFVNRLCGNAFIPVALAYPVGWVVCSLFMLLFYRQSAICRPERVTK